MKNSNHFLIQNFKLKEISFIFNLLIINDNGWREDK